MYLLIIGAPRSGTTLFASMISAHNEVAMLIEDRFFAVKKLTGKKILANKLCIPHQTELVKRANYFSRIAKKIGLLKNYTTSSYNINDYINLPDSKIFAIIRNGHDVVSSIKKRGGKEEKSAIYRWQRAMEIIYQLKIQNADKVALISYEELVKRPEEILRQLSLLLNIEFQPQMLEGYKYNFLYPGENKIDSSKAVKENLSSDSYKFSEKSLDQYTYLKKYCI